VPTFEQFFQDIDAGWKWPATDKILIRVLGSAALMLQANYERGTKDGDNNLHRVERDIYATDEAEIDLPNWV
jgi:hypothetical protein